MLRERINTSRYSIFEKILSIDYFLILIVILIGSISVFAIYSTEGGNFSYYTKNHLIRLLFFFSMFLILSFIRILTWYRFAYFFYLIALILLILVLFFGISASGSTRCSQSRRVQGMTAEPSVLSPPGESILTAILCSRISRARQ